MIEHESSDARAYERAFSARSKQLIAELRASVIARAQGEAARPGIRRRWRSIVRELATLKAAADRAAPPISCD